MAFPPTAGKRTPMAPTMPAQRPLPMAANHLIRPDQRDAMPGSSDPPPELTNAVGQLVQQYGAEVVQQALDAAQSNTDDTDGADASGSDSASGSMA